MFRIFIVVITIIMIIYLLILLLVNNDNSNNNNDHNNNYSNNISRTINQWLAALFFPFFSFAQLKLMDIFRNVLPVKE